MKNFFIMMLFAFFGINLTEAQTLEESFKEQKQTDAPIYSDEFYWSALPWREDAPDSIPDPQYVNRQDSAIVDVFYVHPTTITKNYGKWNQDLSDKKQNNKVDNLPVKLQASVFNGSARVFAPRYRQANYEAFMELGSENSNLALGLAYQDVKAAFLYYLENWNNGRPFIIAGHSQGTFHEITLVKELIDTTALLEQMVAAYLVGMPIKDGDFENCKPCLNATATNCFISWNTMKKKNYPDFYEDYFEGAICQNPLSWECNADYISDEKHKGLVPREFKLVGKKRYGAQVHEGILWVDAVNIPGIPFTKMVKNWHIGDYNLFYGNIRENVNLRVAEYLKNNKTWATTNLELEAK